MRKRYLSSLLLLMLSWLLAPGGRAQDFIAGFNTAPNYSCSTSGEPLQPNCFQVTLNGVVYVFAFAANGGGGSFLHINTGGVGNGPSMDLQSTVFDKNTGEKMTITRLDGGTFSFSSIYVDHLEVSSVAKEPVTVQPFLGSVPAAGAQTVNEGGKQTLDFNGVTTSSVQITSNDFYYISLDDFTICVPPMFTLTKGASCPGQPTQFTSTSSNVAPGASYLWDFNDDGTTDATTSAATASFTYPAPGNYTAKLTVRQGACEASSTIPVNIVPRSTAVLTGGGQICAADSATLSIALTGTGPWTVAYSDGSTTYITPGVLTSPYVVKVKPVVNTTYTMLNVADVNNCPGTASGAVSVTVENPPVITVGPAGGTKCVGEPVGFSVSATGTGLAYQWKKNGNNIGGATGSTFSIPSASTGDAGSYTVQVSGACGTPVTSAAAVLVVNQPPVFTSQPINDAVCAGGNASFSAGASNATGYHWQVNTGSGFANLANGGVYSGATTGTLNITGATAGMDGYQYRVVVTGACPPPVILSGIATLDVSTSPSITSVDVTGTQCVGGAVNFSVTATGTDLTYQWKKNGTDIAGATSSTFNISSTVVGDAGTYTVVVGAACGSPVVSDPIVRVVSVPPAITSQPAPVAICAGSNASFSVGASNATGYRWQVNTGSGFVNLANGGVYSGANTATLLITGATTALNGYQYRAIASGTCLPAATSTATALSVGTPTALGSFTPLTAPVLIGTPVKMTISFIGDAPASAVWNWNDGTTSNATVAGNTLTGTHVYATQNVYTPSITVTSCGVTATQFYEYVVVYDPNGGFITGGGWFNSPAGAYRPQPSLEGRVNFGFVSKYKKGTTVPDGSTEFQYRMGNLSFHSTAYEWLVISGAKGQFKGSGTINGTGSYGFILTAIDGGKRPDRLRMKIWNKANNALVYDNQFGAGDTADPTTVINGGSILIKAPSKTAREGFDADEAGAVLSSGPSAYPNPFRDRVTVDLSGMKPGKVRLDLTDGQGHPVHRQDVELNGNQSAVELELGHLKRGMYLLQARGNGDRKFIKLIKL